MSKAAQWPILTPFLCPQAQDSSHLQAETPFLTRCSQTLPTPHPPMALWVVPVTSAQNMTTLYAYSIETIRCHLGRP